MSHIISVDGIDYEIENWDEFKTKILNAIGFQLVPAIQDMISGFNLIDTSNFWNSIDFEIINGELVLFSTAPYAEALEFGTYDFGKAYGIDTFPKKPIKKKDLSASLLARLNLPKGMAPFAPFRRVLYNQNKMDIILAKAFRAASK